MSIFKLGLALTKQQPKYRTPHKTTKLNEKCRQANCISGTPDERRIQFLSCCYLLFLLFAKSTHYCWADREVSSQTAKYDSIQQPSGDVLHLNGVALTTRQTLISLNAFCHYKGPKKLKADVIRKKAPSFVPCDN